MDDETRAAVEHLQQQVREAFHETTEIKPEAESQAALESLAAQMEQAHAAGNLLEAHRLMCDVVALEHRQIEYRLAVQHHQFALQNAVQTIIDVKSDEQA